MYPGDSFRSGELPTRIRARIRTSKPAARMTYTAPRHAKNSRKREKSLFRKRDAEFRSLPFNGNRWHKYIHAGAGLATGGSYGSDVLLPAMTGSRDLRMFWITMA